jgi:putative ABC transport system permease protein
MQDLRDALRAIRAAPLLSAVAILSLALGIGANTAIFSILNSLLLKSLSVLEPSQLVVVDSVGPDSYSGVGYPVWKAIRERHVFDHAFAWATDRVDLSGPGETAVAEAVWATGDLFEVLGVPAVLGRTFDARDDRRGGGADGPVALISYEFWQRRFGGTVDTIGRTLTIERVPFTIVGVTPPSFLGLNVGTGFDVMLPLETEPLLGRIPQRLDMAAWTWLQIMARRTPGQTAESLTIALRGAQPRIRDATMPPFDHAEDRDRYLHAAWMARGAAGGVSRFRGQYGTALSTFLAIVGLVLLVACANIATLMLARTEARRYEFSVRLAIGASRARLVRQVLAESLFLSAVGAAMGLAFAQWGSRLLVGQLSTWAYTAVLDLSLDWRVLAVTAATTVMTAVLFGAAPAYRAARVEPIEGLKLQPRALGGGTSALTGGPLVIVQVALSLVLVVGAGLFLRSFAALAYRDLGFDRSRVLVADIDARRTAVPVASRAALYERVREAVARVPGVESAATSMATPLGSAGMRFTRDTTVAGHAVDARREVRILTNPVSPDWFRTFGTRLLAGRDFDARDRAGAPNVAIVNAAFTRHYFGVANPVGRTLAQGSSPTDLRQLEIVGLVQDAAFASVREPVEPTIYRPLAQPFEETLLTSVSTISVSIRGARASSPAPLPGRAAAASGGVDHDLTMTFRTVTETLSIYYIRERLLALLSGFFGALALLLAALGLYGVTSYAVGRQRMEIGIRMALGATRSAVVRMVLGRVTLHTGLGIVVGAIASLWATRFIGTLLFNIPPRDPLTFGASAAVLALIAGLAGWLPAHRAARIDPAVVLREG